MLNTLPNYSSHSSHHWLECSTCYLQNHSGPLSPNISGLNAQQPNYQITLVVLTHWLECSTRYLKNHSGHSTPNIIGLNAQHANSQITLVIRTIIGLNAQHAI
ncbi:hypothetical protein CEXT_770051 [Caerostris extrusa]|uniref:Uncharacterized protein n=1 Tax=Caerostris extrusa TaxID=172846 RepID=A0AAV4Y0W3_CAEEX|nr:hypothetical protein CEXT_770051 [Caerostris extrusa]